MQKVRFSDQFDCELEVDKSLDPESTFIPPRLAQLFIENAIEHGIRNLGSKGIINIRFIRSNNTIIQEVEDNGIGREKAQELLKQRDKTHKSMAIDITCERIAILNRKLKRKNTMEIVDMKDAQGEASGTRVVFGVPV
jgi:LytS/YehU family sensor histidine kinase